MTITGIFSLRAVLAAGITIFCLSLLPAQVRFYLRATTEDLHLFKGNIKNLKTEYFDYQNDTIVFILKSKPRVDSVCTQLISHFRDQSFLAVSIDSLRIISDSVASARIHLGPPMYWIKLRPADTESATWMSAVRSPARQISGRPLYYQSLIRLQRDILQLAESSGYPFAAVRLDSIEIQADGGVEAVLAVDRNRFFSIKSFKVNGDVRLPDYFLPRYLGLYAGAPYSRERVLRLREELNTLLFLESTANPTVTFAGNQATINLFLQKKRANRFDFILGILPQPEDENGKVLLTGSVNAAFQNALNLGERFSIELERLRPETQLLNVQTSVPYLFGTPFGADGRLEIFKRDSSWVDAQGELGVQYLLPRGNYFRIFWENRSASLQKIDTAAIIATRRLPANLDLRQNSFGVECNYSRLDYRFNPRKGWLFSIKVQAGINKVQRNNQIESLLDPAQPEFQFSSLYDSVETQSGRLRVEAQGEYYVPVFQRTAVKLAVRAGGIFSDKPVFANEQYRLGGNKLLRGFNEELFQATRFAVATAEWRLLVGRNSFFAAFFDWGYVENLTDRTRFFLRPMGIGAGLNFETRAGIFGISVAAGKQDSNQSFDLRAPKFHIGYINLL